MVKITGIEYYIKTKAQVSTDEGSAFVLTRRELSWLGLKEGMTLSDEKYRDIYEEYVVKKCKQKVLEILKMSDRSEKELRDKLKRNRFPEDAIDTAIEYAYSYHYIDNERYARNYMTYRGHAKSKRQLAFELGQKGIDGELLKNMLEDGCEDEEEKIRRLFKRRYTPEDLESPDKKNKIYGYFMRKGFTYSDISSALKDIHGND